LEVDTDISPKWVKRGFESADGSTVRSHALLLCAVAALGCASTSASEDGKQTSQAALQRVDVPPALRGLRVRIADEVAIVVEGSADTSLSDRLKAALQSELTELGIVVVRPNDKNFDIVLRIDTRVTGAMQYLRGHVAISAEKAGATLASGSTGRELHAADDFATLMTRKALEQLLRSPALVSAVDMHPRHEAAPARAPVVARATRPVRDPAAEAKAHSSRATTLYNLGRFGEALAEYEAAYMAIQDPPFLFNVAQCHRKLGHSQEALDSYRGYLRVAPHAPNRGEVERRIDELERHVHAAR
jgi:tetratricopeptide (TPR) repeat protein